MKLVIGTDTVTPVYKDPVLWAGGVNPKLMQTFYLNLNLGSDTSYSTTTPSTTSKTILASSQTTYRQTSGSLDLANYDYLIIFDCIIPHKYTSTPTVVNTLCNSQKSIYHVGRRYNGTSSVIGYGAVSVTNFPVCRYRNAAGTTISRGATVGYAVGISAATPALTSTSSDTPKIYLHNPAITVRTSSTYMDSGAWSKLDSTNTNIKCRWEIYRVDKRGVATIAYTINGEQAVAEDFQSNFVMLGEN